LKKRVQNAAYVKKGQTRLNQSAFKLFDGFALAAWIGWKLMVIIAISTARPPDTMIVIQPMVVL
jgi:hypothetical protein